MPKAEKKFIVNKSPIQGKGAFASRDIREGELVCTFHGKKIAMKTLEKMFDKGNSRTGADPLQVGIRTYVILDDPYNLINHSCDPNVAIRGEYRLVAIKPIKKGEELAYDYSAVEWTPQEYPPYYSDYWPMECNCGAKSCRKLAACFAYLPKTLQKKYIKSKAVPDHILKKLDWPKNKQRCFVCEKKLGIKLRV